METIRKELKKMSNDNLNQFAKTAKIESVQQYNYFRGTEEETREIIDLYDIEYII